MKNHSAKSTSLLPTMKIVDKNIKPLLSPTNFDLLRRRNGAKAPSSPFTNGVDKAFFATTQNQERGSPTKLSADMKDFHAPLARERPTAVGDRYKTNSVNLTPLNSHMKLSMISPREKSMTGSTSTPTPEESVSIEKDSPIIPQLNFGLSSLVSAGPKPEFSVGPKPDYSALGKNEGNTFEIFMTRMNKLTQKNILPNYEPTRYSDKSHGIVKGFAVCTNQGLVRNYNEDRVAIVLNILRPPNRPMSDYWPNCSFFGVYDGHGGNKCAEFLRNNLHQYIIRSKYFPWNAQEALKEAFDEADRTFLDIASKDTENGQNHDRSGSCAVALLIIDDMCYIANVGDSRAILSQNNGSGKYSLTRDHKPSDKMEQKRIADAGGKVYQNFPIGVGGKRLDLDPKYNPFKISIPVRVLPGRLSVSRAVGDIEAKFAKFGGNPNVIIGKPEITTIKINKEHDFIFMGSKRYL